MTPGGSAEPPPTRGGAIPGYGRIEMSTNTGTYLDTPFHRFADGFDLAELPLDNVADLG